MKNNIQKYFGILPKLFLMDVIIIIITILIGWIIGLRQSIEYSNVFFIIGGLFVAFGTLSVMGGLKIRGNFELIYAQSAGKLSLLERTKQNIDNSESIYSSSVLFALSGILFIIISIGIDKIF